MKSISKYFADAALKKASDLHLVAGEKPMCRVQGELQELDEAPLPEKELEQEIFSLLSADQKKQYQEELELDLSVEMDGARFRVNVHQQEEKIGLAARLIPEAIPTPEELRFTPTMKEFPNLLDGLVLVVGPTGSGKSTTLASMVEEINKNRKAHIVTVEDPVEFLFKNKQSLIEQREVGIDTKSFAAALKHVLRQDPNVILVGEMRDPETIATVLTAAETGHLVFSTLHTNSAAEAVERIVDVFEGPKQRQVLIQLAAVLRGVICQQLIPGKKGAAGAAQRADAPQGSARRVAAREILVNTPAVANLIRENNIAQLKSVIQTGVKEGMMTMEMSLKQLLKEGVIDEETVERRMGRQKRV